MSHTMLTHGPMVQNPKSAGSNSAHRPDGPAAEQKAGDADDFGEAYNIVHKGDNQKTENTRKPNERDDKPQNAPDADVIQADHDTPESVLKVDDKDRDHLRSSTPHDETDIVPEDLDLRESEVPLAGIPVITAKTQPTSAKQISETQRNTGSHPPLTLTSVAEMAISSVQKTVTLPAPETSATDAKTPKAPALIETSGMGRKIESPVENTKPQASAAPVQTAALAPQAQSVVKAGDLGQAEPRASLKSDDLRESRRRRSSDRTEQAWAAFEKKPPQASQTHAPAQNNTASSAAVNQIAMSPLSSSTGDPTLTLDGELELMRSEIASTSTTSSSLSSTTPTSVFNRADVPRSIAFQLQGVAKALGDKPVDVSLNPQELGRVRLSITTTEQGVTLQILAERPETLDLMKRNSDMLAKEFASLGFTSVDLSFGQGNTSSQDDKNSGSDEDAGKGRSGNSEEITHETASSPSPAAQHLNLSGETGIDIRV